MYDDAVMPPPRLNDPADFENLPDFFQTSITRERFFWRWNTPQKYETNLRAYYRMQSGIDAAIGRFEKALAEAGLKDNTIIVYSADNGFHMGNRGLAGKWSHFEESLRVPLIIYDPRLPTDQRGKVTDALALNLDLPSTFLDWAGVAVPDRYQGRSLRSIVSGEVPADWRTETFHEHFAVRNRIPAWEGLRNDRFKYARYFDYNGMLYEEKGRRIRAHTGEKVIVAPDGRPWIVGRMPVKEFRAGEWHEYRVLVEANRHRHWIDGHQTADLIDLDENGRALEGVLAMQVHVGPAMKVQFKDVRIKHLPDDMPLLQAEAWSV